MKKLLVLTAVAALVATTAVEARGGFGGARGFTVSYTHLTLPTTMFV